MQDFYDICRKKQDGEINISWNQIAEMYNLVSGNAAKKKWYRYKNKKYLSNDAIKQEQPNTDIFNKIQIEKQKLKNEKNEIKKYMRKYANIDNILDEIKDCIDKLPKLDLSFIDDMFVYEDSNKELIVMISDLHIGQISTMELNEYNFEVLKNRLIKYFNEIKLIAYENEVNKIHLCFMGDLIEGLNIYKSIKDYSDIDPIEQVIRTSEILSVLINNLSKEFQIEISYVFGNHSILGYDFKYTTNFEKIIIKFLEVRLQNNNNVNINSSNGIYTIVNSLGYKYLLMHGDGYKNKDINALKIKDILSSAGEYFDEIIIGHWHHSNNKETFSNGGNVIVCGSFVGGNEYSFKKLQNFSKASQTVFVVDDKKGRTATYNVKLN